VPLCEKLLTGGAFHTFCSLATMLRGEGALIFFCFSLGFETRIPARAQGLVFNVQFS